MDASAAQHGSVVVELGATPPSYNALAYSHWRKTHRTKQAWQGDLVVLFLSERLPKPLIRARVSATLRFTQRRRRDEGNYRVLLEKACGDALVTGGWLADDTPEHYRFGHVEFEAERGAARTLVRVEYEREVAMHFVTPEQRGSMPGTWTDVAGPVGTYDDAVAWAGMKATSPVFRGVRLSVRRTMSGFYVCAHDEDINKRAVH
jgi:hypothetical protein